ncbi:hypothetical protein Adt_08464 [Abeliophyllum distichum]|uniref:Uncharacterized protein n=1 Tax=Abeliophyllum distichum TaxID=126358 RepID=A0ABD1VEV0_9LAMI
MAVSPHLKTLHSLFVFSIKASFNLSFMQLKTLIRNFILSELYRLIRAFFKAKAILVDVLEDVQRVRLKDVFLKIKKNEEKLFFGSFRLNRNWRSPDRMPVLLQAYNAGPAYCNDSKWNDDIETEYDGLKQDSELSGYLRWLEEEDHEDDCSNIDELAEMFIENCYEKFMLEKQDSYRKYQEMMARSL